MCGGSEGRKENIIDGGCFQLGLREGWGGESVRWGFQ